MSVSGSALQRIGQIAGAQRGRIARRQLEAAGVGPATVNRLVARGQLLRRHRGVFAVGHAATVELGDETVALLAVRDGAALSHQSAAALWDMLQTPDTMIHLVVVESAAARLPGVVVHRTRILAPEDVVIHKSLPVTSPARTLLDVAADRSSRSLELAFDRALVARILRTKDVNELLGRSKGHPGHGALQRLARRERQSATLTRSEAEERFLALIRAADLPPPRVNSRLHGYEVDFYWPEHGLVVETDGFRYHSTRRAFEHDHRKDTVLLAAGLIVLRFTFTQLESEPFAVVAAVARALASR